MLTQEEAAYYQEQLHPVFAGYLHDGTITDRDSLATIFHFFIKGVLDPVWEDGSMKKGLVGARLTGKKPQYPFEQLILNALFDEKNEITTREIGEMIKTPVLQMIIKQNLQAVQAFPIVNQELQFSIRGVPIEFSMNGEKIDTLQEAKQFKRNIVFFLIPVFAFMGYMSVMIYGINQDPRKNLGDNMMILFSFSIFFIIAIGFFIAQRTIHYDFANKVVPVAKKKYDQLYEFLKNRPLQKHTFINESLPFSIAFGLDTSWQKDFGLENES